MFKELMHFVDKNSPVILTSLGVVGVISTAVSAIHATPKALQILEKSGDIREFKTWEKDKKLEFVKDISKTYAPTIIMGGATILCIVGANRIASKRTVALASLYSIAEKNLDRYKIKANEIIGEKKMQKVRDAVEVEKTEAFPVEQEVIFATGKGNNLCFETFTGRYFRSDIEQIRKTINDMNFELLNNMCLSLNSFYAELGLPRIDIGDEVGWTADNIIDASFTCKLAETGEPCLIMTLNVEPKYEFGRFY